jgi:hypothetical protein
MTRTEKYDKLLPGAVAGFVIPVLIGLIVYLISAGQQSIGEYVKKIVGANIITHIISLCVFPNIFLFLIFIRLDMLRAARGVLGITLFWAVIVFTVKFLL